MGEVRISIAQVKQDISALVDRVAYGGERVVLTARGKPKAAIVSMEDYKRLLAAANGDDKPRLEAWLAASDRLAARILAHREGMPLDADALLDRARSDLEARHDFLRGD